MPFMLDTDTVSFALRGRGRVAARLRDYRPSEICISSITLCELRYGADVRRSETLHSLIDEFVKGVAVLPFDQTAADCFGKVAAALRKQGTPIGEFDTLIAAHARAVRATLVTNNLKHFERIAGLTVENWI